MEHEQVALGVEAFSKPGLAVTKTVPFMKLPLKTRQEHALHQLADAAGQKNGARVSNRRSRLPLLHNWGDK